MPSYKEFLQRCSRELVDHISIEADPSTNLEFVSSVLQEWTTQYSRTPLPEATLSERTFWFSLYLMEDVEEERIYACEPCAYALHQIEELKSMRRLLLNNVEIPDGKWATRPDGT